MAKPKLSKFKTLQLQQDLLEYGSRLRTDALRLVEAIKTKRYTDKTWKKFSARELIDRMERSTEDAKRVINELTGVVYK